MRRAAPNTAAPSSRGLPEVGIVERALSLLAQAPRRRPTSAWPSAPIPPVIASRLRPDNDDEPLFPKLASYGRGRPGVTHEREWWWVIRDERGRVVGGAMVADMERGHPVAIDVAVDPVRQGEGWASRLYAELEARGIDMEGGSSASLAHCTMTPDGYRFMVARRRRSNPDAEAAIVAVAAVCPGCGVLDEHGRGVDGANT